jgi:MGT family glycosyltransferase
VATIAFFPEGAYGPTNNCVGIGAKLQARGHRVVFIVEESFAGQLQARGFEERLMRLGPPPDQEEAPGQFWKDFIRDTAPVFRRPTIEQLEQFIAPTFKALIDGSRYVDERIGEIIAELEPDVVVEDNVVGFPALDRSGRPWVRIVSCHPAELKDEIVPPAFSGYETANRDGWAEYRAEYARVIGPLHREHDEFYRSHGAPALPEDELIGVSPWLNLYLYPRVLDYLRSVPPAGRWLALESCVRDEPSDWQPPAGDCPLVYLSLGSLGSADTGLMQELLDTLGTADDLRVVASLGPQHELLRVPDRITGAEYVPQTLILRKASAVITHGGNNTVTESIHFGCPMVLLPLFWDQYDNAQRVPECGLGIRLDTYGHAPDQLLGAVRSLLADRALHERMHLTSERLHANPGAEVAAQAIESVAAGQLTRMSSGVRSP